MFKEQCYRYRARPTERSYREESCWITLYIPVVQQQGTFLQVLYVRSLILLVFDELLITDSKIL